MPRSILKSDLLALDGHKSKGSTVHNTLPCPSGWSNHGKETEMTPLRQQLSKVSRKEELDRYSSQPRAVPISRPGSVRSPQLAAGHASYVRFDFTASTRSLSFLTLTAPNGISRLGQKETVNPHHVKRSLPKTISSYNACHQC